MTTVPTIRCSSCGHPVSADAVRCSACGALLGRAGRQSTAFELLKAALAVRYPIERLLGQGGMATVYLARDLKHGRPVAVKVLRPEISPILGAERFLREIEVAATLQHPHILPVHDSGEALVPGYGAPFLYYVMPYVQGESLRARLRREMQLPFEDAVTIAQEVADALDYAHRQDVVHRDIKPENILLSEGHAIVADFGIARAIHSSAEESLTATGIVIGTPAYMSPEQSTGSQGEDGRGDIYSLGCVLYEMLAGRPPYTGSSAQAIIAKRLSAPITSLRTVRPEMPHRLEQVVMRALAPRAEDRFSTAGQMAAALGSGMPRRLESTAVTSPSHGSSKRSRLRISLAIGLAALLAIVVGLAVRRSSTSQPTPTVNSRIVVLPFGYYGSPQSKYLSHAMVTLLSSVLDGVGDLRTVDPSAVLALAGDEAPGGLKQERALEIANRLGAGRYITGNVVEGAAGQFTMSAAAYEVPSGMADGQRATVEGSGLTQMFRLVNDLAVQLLGALEIRQSAPRLESISTGSIVALNEYLKGESALRKGSYGQAAEAFGRAVAADSLFALAWFRESYALTFTETPEKAEPAVQQALALKSRLSERDRRLAEALAAILEVQPAVADRLYRALVYDYPDDVEAWFGRGDVVLHFGPQYGLSMDSLSQTFERVLLLDPSHGEARAHLPWAAGLDGRLTLLDSAVSRYLASDSAGYYAPVFRTLRAFALGDSAAEAAALAKRNGMDDLQRLLAVNMTAALGDPVRTQQLAGRLFIEPTRLPEVQAFGHLLDAFLEHAQGRHQSVAADLAAADTLEPASALEHRALLALLPFRETPGAELRDIRDRVQRWNAAGPNSGAPANLWLAPHAGLHPQLRLYLLGALSARMGDNAGARRYATELMRVDSSRNMRVIGPALGHEILAQLAVASGKPSEALRELEQTSLGDAHTRTWERAYSSPFFSQSLGRMLRARLLANVGREDEALRWYGSLWMANAFDLVYVGPARLGEAEIYDRRGDRDRALQEYKRVIELWRDADPELRATVKRVKARIALLEKGG
jgi:serine/threonine protein kinase/tetratricopeptide (TPR) repeat protein